MPLLLDACPSFSERWEGPDVHEGELLLYVDVGDFAHHLVELMQQGCTREFPAVFDVVERLHLEGDAYVQELATIGLLEGIQNAAGWRRLENNNMSPEAFLPYLRPETARRWHQLNEQWRQYFDELDEEFGGGRV